jgi:hypothetical protein
VDRVSLRLYAYAVRVLAHLRLADRVVRPTLLLLCVSASLGSVGASLVVCLVVCFMCVFVWLFATGLANHTAVSNRRWRGLRITRVAAPIPIGGLLRRRLRRSTSLLCVHWCAATKSAEPCRTSAVAYSGSSVRVLRRRVPRWACAVNEAFPPSHFDSTRRRHERLRACTGTRTHDDGSYCRRKLGAFSCSGSRCSSP